MIKSISVIKNMLLKDFLERMYFIPAFGFGWKIIYFDNICSSIWGTYIHVYTHSHTPQCIIKKFVGWHIKIIICKKLSISSLFPILKQ